MLTLFRQTICSLKSSCTNKRATSFGARYLNISFSRGLSFILVNLMERKLTLKQFTLLPVILILAFVARAQNYNNIEFIENKGQWDSRVKFKGDVTGGAIFIRSGGFTVLQHNQQDFEVFRK